MAIKQIRKYPKILEIDSSSKASDRRATVHQARNMLGSVVSIPRLTVPNHFHHQSFHPYMPIRRWGRQKSSVIECCKRAEERSRTEKNYYELLGVSVDSTAQEIKDTYRKLQKKYHPDIAGQKSHGYTLKLNEAYKVLMREDLRREYDASIGQLRLGFGRNIPDLGYSSWKGNLRPQALFVDENACIGCGECVHHATNTFTMDESLGCARVRVQYGDDDRKLEVSVNSCPVNCIYWVEREELPVLEFLIRPQPKAGHGIFGQGWERPKNVFMAAKAFNKQLEREATNHQRNAGQTVEKETPAQAAARVNASMKSKTQRFSKVWELVNHIFCQY